MANVNNWMSNLATHAQACIICHEDFSHTRRAGGWCSCGVNVCVPCYHSSVSMAQADIEARRGPRNRNGVAPIVQRGDVGGVSLLVIRCPSCAHTIPPVTVMDKFRVNVGLNAVMQNMHTLKTAIDSDNAIAATRSAEAAEVRADRDRLRERLCVCEQQLMDATRNLSAIRGIVATTATQPGSPIADTEVDPPSSSSEEDDFSCEYARAVEKEVLDLMLRYKTNETMRLLYFYQFGRFPDLEQGRHDMARDIAADKEFNEPMGYVRRRESGRADRMRARRGLERGPSAGRRALQPQ
jgi:hypothetical protein